MIHIPAPTATENTAHAKQYEQGRPTTDVAPERLTEYVVKLIINSQAANRRTLLLVRWYNYGPEDGTRNSASSLSQQFIARYELVHNRRLHCRRQIVLEYLSELTGVWTSSQEHSVQTGPVETARYPFIASLIKCMRCVLVKTKGSNERAGKQQEPAAEPEKKWFLRRPLDFFYQQDLECPGRSKSLFKQA